MQNNPNQKIKSSLCISPTISGSAFDFRSAEVAPEGESESLHTNGNNKEIEMKEVKMISKAKRRVISKRHSNRLLSRPFGLEKSSNLDCDSNSGHDPLFDNLPKLMRPEQVALYFGYSTTTIYDWKYRGQFRGVPKGLFLSLNRRLYVRTDLFLTWIASQNPDLELGAK